MFAEVQFYELTEGDCHCLKSEFSNIAKAEHYPAGITESGTVVPMDNVVYFNKLDNHEVSHWLLCEPKKGYVMFKDKRFILDLEKLYKTEINVKFTVNRFINIEDGIILE